MVKEIRKVDPERNILQITTIDERWYAQEESDPNTGLPIIVYRPSVTWICSHYPKGKGFEIWLKKNGDESDILMMLAGERGYKIHRAVAKLNEGESVGIGDCFENHDGKIEPLTVEEYAGLMSYVQWWETEGCDAYEILQWEYTLWPDMAACAERYGLPSYFFFFAGTIDLRVRRRSDNTIGIIDLKTSKDIYTSHELQVSAYKKAAFADWCAILQINYTRNKIKKYKFTEVKDCFELFAATQKIWQHETEGTEPLQRDFPLSLSLRKSDKPPYVPAA